MLSIYGADVARDDQLGDVPARGHVGEVGQRMSKLVQVPELERRHGGVVERQFVFLSSPPPNVPLAPKSTRALIRNITRRRPDVRMEVRHRGGVDGGGAELDARVHGGSCILLVALPAIWTSAKSAYVPACRPRVHGAVRVGVAEERDHVPGRERRVGAAVKRRGIWFSVSEPVAGMLPSRPVIVVVPSPTMCTTPSPPVATVSADETNEVAHHQPTVRRRRPPRTSPALPGTLRFSPTSGVSKLRREGRARIGDAGEEKSYWISSNQIDAGAASGLPRSQEHAPSSVRRDAKAGSGSRSAAMSYQRAR